MLRGADLLAEGLARHGVRHVFGMPGSHSTTIYDAIVRHGTIATILVRNEQAGAFAADGYARATGRPGVLCTTAGPGATNALTGLAECWADSVPVLLLSGQVNADGSTRNVALITRSISEALFRPVTQWCATARARPRIPALLGRAFEAMTCGRPRPAALFLPQDLMRREQSHRSRPRSRGVLQIDPDRPYLPTRSPRPRRSWPGPSGPLFWPEEGPCGGTRPPRSRPSPDTRRPGRHHAQRQGTARRTQPALARPRPLGPGRGRAAACRRHARGRLPVHRGHDRLAADGRAPRRSSRSTSTPTRSA